MNRPLRIAVLAILSLGILPDDPLRAEGPLGPSRGTRVVTWPAAEPVAIGREPQLFLDGYLIAEHEGLKRAVHPPRRALDRPVIGAEQGTTQPYVTVIRDPGTGRFRMWYDRSAGPEGAIAYAESEDGLAWTAPRLGILGDDNRVLRIGAPFQSGYGVSVIDEGPEFPDRARRHKVAYWGQEKPWGRPSADGGGDPGMRVAFSPDGLHWTRHDGNPVIADFGERWFLDDPRRPYGAGDIVDVYRDPIRGCYAGFVKVPAVPADGYTPGRRAGLYIRRLVAASESGDFLHWSRPRRVLVPEARDEGQLEFYGVGGTIERGGLLMGFARMLRDDLPADPGGPPDGVGWTALVTSRDGRAWERDDEVFFDRSPDPGAWDRAMAWIGSAVPVGDELFLYYGGYRRGHKVEPAKERQIGLARTAMDRFVSRDAAGDAPGRLLTVPLRMTEEGPRRLALNAAAAAGGEVRVAVRDAGTCEVLPGYALEDAAPVSGDGPALPAAWREKIELPAGTVRLEFRIVRASLYGFRLAGPEGRREPPRPAARPVRAPLEVGRERQLFIDRRFIERSSGIRIAMNPPVKAGAVMECDRPWEDFRLTSYFTVVQDGGLCRMYYSSFSRDQWHTPRAWEDHAFLCYAESVDGIHWTKPSLGIVEFEGSRDNNILLRGVVDGTVFIDPAAPPERRYKLLSTVGPHRGGLRVWCSADGIRFAGPAEPVSPWTPDSQQNAFRDDRIGAYVAYLRGRPEMGLEVPSRLVVRVQVEDIEKPWDARPQVVLRTDAGDPPDVDFYTNACVRYRWAGDAYFMFPALYRHFPREKGNDGLLDISMAVSRDGIEWERPDRRPYMRLGLRDEWDAFFEMMGVGMVRVGDRLFQYYNGVDLTHGGTRGMSEEERGKRRRWGKIGRVVQRLDGFLSADADPDGGWFETPPMVHDGDRLVLNIDTSAAGTARVGIAGAAGEAIPGRSIGDCDEILANSCEHTVTWRGKAALGDLAGRPIRLRFEMRSAKLHAFQFQR